MRTFPGDDETEMTLPDRPSGDAGDLDGNTAPDPHATSAAPHGTGFPADERARLQAERDAAERLGALLRAAARRRLLEEQPWISANAEAEAWRARYEDLRARVMQATEPIRPRRLRDLIRARLLGP